MLKFIGFYDYTVILTYLSLVSAVVGIVQASKENYTAAIICLLMSGICDAFDGKVARSKKNRIEDEKSFGIQLDSLCDCVSFGVCPAFICYHMGVNGIFGVVSMCIFCLCAVIRLAYFNVMEIKRQQVEEGCNTYYQGLPVTAIAIIFPFIYLFRSMMVESSFVIVLHIMLLLVAFLFVYDFKVKKIKF